MGRALKIDEVGKNRVLRSRKARNITRFALNKVASVRNPSPRDFQEMGRRVRRGFPTRPDSLRILLVTSNGAGLGHLSRVNAVSQFLTADSLIYTMSSAYKVLGRPPHGIIYFPSYGDLGMAGSSWNAMMRAHFKAVFDAFDPDAVVFDGTFVYRGVVETVKKSPCPLIWIQRGCWRPEVDANSDQRHNASKYVDFVVVPGDYGNSEIVDERSGVPTAYTSPIVSTQSLTSLSRTDARAELGLPEGKKIFLVQLGAGLINDTKSIVDTAISEINSLGDEWMPVLAKNPLSSTRATEVQSVQRYPLAQYFNAFDCGIFAGGYNSCQEAVDMGLPSIFVPNLETKTDDQARRAKGIEAAGYGFAALTEAEIRDRIRLIAEESKNLDIRNKLSTAEPAEGALETARIVEHIARYGE